MSDLERQQNTGVCHRHPLPCSSFTGGNWRLWLVSAHKIFNTESGTPIANQFYVSRGTLQCSLHIRLKGSWNSSAEMTESQLIKFMGKKKPTLDMMGEGNSSFSLWRNRAGTLGKSTKSDMSFIFIHLQSNISSDAENSLSPNKTFCFALSEAGKKNKTQTNLYQGLLQVFDSKARPFFKTYLCRN